MCVAYEYIRLMLKGELTTDLMMMVVHDDYEEDTEQNMSGNQEAEAIERVTMFTSVVCAEILHKHIGDVPVTKTPIIGGLTSENQEARPSPRAHRKRAGNHT